MPDSLTSPARRVLLAAATLAVLGGVAAVPAAASDNANSPYIVVLHDDVQRPGAVADEHRRDHGAEVTHTYTAALKGYAARLSGRALAEVRSDRRVAYVEPDGVATTQATQDGATWGLDRIDARSGLDGTFSYESTGRGVTAYVIDTGIRYTHSDLAGRTSFGYDAFGGDGNDCNGHGTHVAGTIGGTVHGVAKEVSLVAVRVLDCGGSGSWSGVIAGIDWATGHHGTGPAVANLSLGGGANTAVDDAVKRLIADGVSTAVAAGNGNQRGKEQDACGYSPARVPDAMTIGATDKADAKTSWSNYGSCVDWFAPGASITSAWHTSDVATSTISGTSMATPHVAGVAALHLQTAPDASPLAVRDELFTRSTKSVVTSSRTTNNHLLHSGTSEGVFPTTEPTSPTRGGGKPAK